MIYYAKEIFQKCIKGNNIMTPNNLGYFMIFHHGNKYRVAELTEGNVMSSAIYGVTVVDWNEATGEKSMPALSKCFYKEGEAEEYIRDLQCESDTFGSKEIWRVYAHILEGDQ